MTECPFGAGDHRELIRQAKAEERERIALAIERRRCKRRARWLRKRRWSARDEACWSQGMWDALRIARQQPEETP